MSAAEAPPPYIYAPPDHIDTWSVREKQMKGKRAPCSWCLTLLVDKEAEGCGADHLDRCVWGEPCGAIVCKTCVASGQFTCLAHPALDGLWRCEITVCPKHQAELKATRDCDGHFCDACVPEPLLGSV